VGWGALTLRRRSGGENWVATGNLPSEGTDMASDHVLRIFDAHDRLAAAKDDPSFLLDERLRLADEHEIEQHIRFSEGATVQQVILRLDGGFRFSVGLDGRTTSVLSRLDGRKLREVLAEQASIDDVPRDEFELGALPVMRTLYELGFLVPEGAA
jgi:hypothetical protein